MGARRNKIKKNIYNNLATLVIFGGLSAFVHGGLGIALGIVAVFGGFVPLIRNFFKLGSSALEDKRDEEEIKHKQIVSSEKMVLQSAKDNAGVATPSLIALNTNLSLEEADKLLQDFVSKGYASMEVTDSGKVQYLFSEFLPEEDDRPRLE